VTEEQRLADEPFGDRLARAVALRSSQLVVGLDPDPEALWPRAYELAGSRKEEPARRIAFAVAAHCALVIEAVAEHVVAAKLQVACFERLGPPGWAALQETLQRARARDLLVIADAKRGDIDVTAAAYGQAFFGSTPTPYGEIEGLGAAWR
jgi:orotidine-5'-phosphate decarboxylase